MSWFPQPLLSLPLQKTLKCQNLPQSHRHRLYHLHRLYQGLSRLRALRACSQQDLNLAAWSGPPSKTVPGKRPAWTTPMRSQGSLLSSVASPGQTEEEGSRGEPRTGGSDRVAHTGGMGGGNVQAITLLSYAVLEV